MGLWLLQGKTEKTGMRWVGSQILVKTKSMLILLTFCYSYLAHSFLSQFEVGLRLNSSQPIVGGSDGYNFYPYPIKNLQFTTFHILSPFPSDLKPHIDDDNLPKWKTPEYFCYMEKSHLNFNKSWHESEMNIRLSHCDLGVVAYFAITNTLPQRVIDNIKWVNTCKVFRSLPVI